MEDRQILVFYLGVANMGYDEVEKYVEQVRTKFFTAEFIKNNNCEIFIIPTRERDSRVDCINPVYITDEKLIAEHEEMMKDFNNSLYKLTTEDKKK